MDTFFCAQQSRQFGEDPIANAGTWQTYVFVECPTPWPTEALNSKPIPENLRTLRQELQENDDYIEFFLIYNEEIKRDDSTRVIIYRQETGFAQGYYQYEFSVVNIDEVAPATKTYLLDKSRDIYSLRPATRDIFICTHGSRDKCCAKYGNPFYRKAKTIVNDLSLSNVRVWQCSHFGGHRFAPTAIDFPSGRYYARLDETSFTSILKCTGNLDFLKNVYRGWGILPMTAQVLEREMIFRYGWEWFKYKVACRVINQSDNEEFSRIELSFINPDSNLMSVEADVVIDDSKTLNLIGHCGGEKAELVSQFRVENLSINTKLIHC
ncbi:sucrase ferredoxin [Cronbergia sp. UHCC 0137]|uniref:sucrase ferredoxin n=1 Tax=Cronbergia sp. UHCC 0137 TaxID=3110239 RepID=UPI002B209891|nr:sucrase ferredoxin [Cronbergia sp. UHCC 0137]MEA5617111.1 sucrase ferredoxin [Cronbergia sp. UHCC 0137]